MQSYKYELRDASGQVNSGVIAAGSLAEASSQLRGQGYLLNLQPVSGQVGNLLERMRNISVEMGPGRVKASITFSELDADVGRVAAGLVDLGVAKGDRVAVLVPPGIDLAVCIYACWRMGAVVVVVDAGLGVRGMTRALKITDPAYLIGIPRAMAAARWYSGLRDNVDLCLPTCLAISASDQSG